MPHHVWQPQGTVLTPITESLWSIFRSHGFRSSALPRNLADLADRSGMDMRDLAHIGAQLGLTLDRVVFAAQYLTTDSKSSDPRQRLLDGYRPGSTG